jgi:tryptophan 2-monooxygenase
MPSLTPQSVGVYFSAPLGDWSVHRDGLPQKMLTNAVLLASVETAQDHLQLHLELALHWHCLSSIEKFIVAQVLSALAAESPSVSTWLQHMVEGKLPPTLPLDFTASMPVDHMFDYGGFLEATNRVYGALPPEAAEHSRVCVVGGGVAGIVAADGLNRLGVSVTVFEQADHIGGRLMTVRLAPHAQTTSGGDASSERSVSPTPMEMGGMRFAPFPGNSFYRLIQLYGLRTEPFPNPGGPGVKTMFLIGNELFDDISPEPSSSGAGGAPLSANMQLMQKVRADYMTAMRPLLDPIMKARAHADTTRLRELCEAAVRRFDHNTFQGGLDDLLREQGIAWGTEEWDLFGGIGIGVGGYDGYYTTGFLEEFRFLVDRRLEDHVFLPDGASSVLHAIVDDGRSLPGGRRSLREQGAVRCGIEVERVIKTASGTYEVTSLAKASGKRTTETFTEVLFAAGPSEAIRLGLTSPQPGSLPLMPDGLAKAMRRSNLVGATKLAVKVPIDAFEGLDIPSNIQSTQPFQQVYVLPATPGATSRVIFLSYQLGDNAAKTTALSAEEQFDVFVRIIKNTALATSQDDAKHNKFRLFAELLERGRNRMCVCCW